MIPFLALLAAAAPLRAQQARPELFGPGRFVFTAPAAVEVVHRSEWGMTETNIEVRPGFDFEVLTYSWWTRYALGTPATPQDFLASLQRRAGDDFRVISPAEKSEFQGAPAWTFTRAFTLKPRGGGRDTHVQESYLVVQRRWGYAVVEYSNDAEFYDRDAAQYKDFVAALKFLPDYPAPPLFAGGLILALAALFARLFRRSKK
jgi:hypothetical protein